GVIETTAAAAPLPKPEEPPGWLTAIRALREGRLAGGRPVEADRFEIHYVIDTPVASTQRAVVVAMQRSGGAPAGKAGEAPGRTDALRRGAAAGGPARSPDPRPDPRRDGVMELHALRGVRDDPQPVQDRGRRGVRRAS